MRHVPMLNKTTYMRLYVNNGKWLLLKLDITVKKRTVLNPHGTLAAEAPEYSQLILIFITKYNKLKMSYFTFKFIQEYGWNYKIIPHATITSCSSATGLVNLYFIDGFLSNSKINSFLNTIVTGFLEKILQLLITY